MSHGIRSLSTRVLVGALFLAAAASLWQGTAPGRAAAAQSDLSFISDSTWTADPVAARVHVLAAVTATSHSGDSGGRQTYYDRVQLTLPPSSADFHAISLAGNSLPVTLEASTTSSVIIVVGLAQRLYSNQAGSFILRFDLVDAGGSTDRDLRLGSSLMSFPVWAFGSPGASGSTVTVTFPSSFSVQEEYGGIARSVYPSGQAVFSSGVIADSTELSAWFTAVKPVPAADYKIRFLAIGPLEMVLRYWPDDPGWADQVERVMRSGYPLLRSMIGLGDPSASVLTVEEASSTEIGGFSGSYDTATGKIQISYLADPFVILHEMSHLWFNSDLVSDRWVQEGFASFYAQQAVESLGYVDRAPVVTDEMRQAAIPLNDWVISGDPDSATSAYEYGTSLQVARQIAAQAGQAGLQSVWAAARAGLAAYQPLYGAQTETFSGGPISWRQLLDLLERKTGSSYGYIWQQWVVDRAQASLLPERNTALAAYAEDETAAGSWNLPPEIRQSLDAWQFDPAGALMTQARSILIQRDEIGTEAASEQIEPPLTLKNAFEHSGIAVAGNEAANELAVLRELSAASQAQTDGGGAAQALGLLGADPEADLASARAAFTTGDLSGAMSLATGAQIAWQGANGAGQRRIFGSLCVLSGGLLLLGLFMWGRDRKPRAQTAAAVAALDESTLSGSGVSAPVDVATGASRRKTKPVVAAVAAAQAAEIGEVVATPNRMARSRRMADALLAATKSHGASSGGSSLGDGGGTISGGNVEVTPGREDGSIGSNESAYDLLLRGNALIADRHNAQAAVVLERAARLEHGKGSILEALGRAYFNSGQHARAAETFEELLEIDPSAHYGHFALGLSFARLGRVPEARTHLRLAAALDPASDTYRRALEKIEATES
jgi:Flp pilus assembly protein TadD